MKILVPVDASAAALAPVAHLEALARSGVQIEVLLLNVQPRFHRHIAQFTSRRQRDLLREERSRVAMARAIEALSRTGLRFSAFTEVGTPAERIAAVAERERVDEIMMGVGRHPDWLRWINPSIAQGVMARTDIPVSVLARGRTSVLARTPCPPAWPASPPFCSQENDHEDSRAGYRCREFASGGEVPGPSIRGRRALRGAPGVRARRDRSRGRRPALRPARALLESFHVPYLPTRSRRPGPTIQRGTPGADRIVMGTARLWSVTRLVEDSVIEELLETAPIPVSLVSRKPVSAEFSA